MTVGVGTDVVDALRFLVTLDRSPGLSECVFTPAEHGPPTASLAARLAAKDAIATAPGTLRWRGATVHRTVGWSPAVEITGTVVARAAEFGVGQLSTSSGAGTASATLVAARD